MRAVAGRPRRAGRPGPARRSGRGAGGAAGLAAARGDRSAVIYGSVVGSAADGSPLRDRVAAIARDAGMAVCGGGCMGFVHVVNGRSAIGYIERDPIPAGPVALVTHSGSAFSALLRTRRADRLLTRGVIRPGAGHHDGRLPRVRPRPARDAGHRAAAWRRSATARGWCAALRRAAERRRTGRRCCAVGGSPMGQAMVAAHSGAVAGADAAWEALVRRDRRAAGARPRRDGRHPRTARRPDAERRQPDPGAGHRDGPRLRRRAHVARRRRARARRAVRGASPPTTIAAVGRPARQRSRGDEPARRLGHRRGHQDTVRRLPARDGRAIPSVAAPGWQSTWWRSTTATRRTPMRCST